jgi:hypothetical protein
MKSFVEIVVEGYAQASREPTFDAIVPVDLTTILPGFGPIPGVLGVRDQSGPWSSVGATRLVVLSDGSVTPERITVHQSGRYFAYRVGPFAPPLGLLAAHADGAWWFTDVSAGVPRTHIRWSYTFALTSPAAPISGPVVQRVWRAYARRVLALAIAVAEA